MKWYQITHLNVIHFIHFNILYTLITNIILYNYYNGSFNEIMIVSKMFGLLLFYLYSTINPLLIPMYLYVFITCIFYILFNIEYMHLKYLNNLILYEYFNNIIFIMNIILLKLSYILQKSYNHTNNLNKIICYFPNCELPTLIYNNSKRIYLKYRDYKQNTSNDNNICSICLCELNNITCLPCRHTFHKNCINHPTIIVCPLCRCPIKLNNPTINI